MLESIGRGIRACFISAAGCRGVLLTKRCRRKCDRLSPLTQIYRQSPASVPSTSTSVSPRKKSRASMGPDAKSSRAVGLVVHCALAAVGTLVAHAEEPWQKYVRCCAIRGDRRSTRAACRSLLLGLGCRSRMRNFTGVPLAIITGGCDAHSQVATQPSVSTRSSTWLSPQTQASSFLTPPSVANRLAHPRLLPSRGDGRKRAKRSIPVPTNS
jgi:hypothetical protein